MIIDFHAHIFPEKIAEKTLGILSEKAGIIPDTNGTADGLRRSMKETGVSYSVNLPAITKPSQFESTNRFAAEVNGIDGIISFGGLHPECDCLEDRVDEIAALGLPGIKLHPDYQGCFVDDERYVRVIRRAVERGLLVTLHAGLDNAFPELTHCTPDRSAHMLDLVYGTDEPKEPRIIFAHMGGRKFYDGVVKHLSHRRVFYDLSYILGETEPETVISTVRAHGAELVLFGTDTPWSSQKEDIRRMEALPFTSREMDLIMGENAAALLGV